MGKKVILRESELRGMIREALNEKIENGEIDEDLLGRLGAVGKTIFGKANKAANMAGKGLQNVGNNIKAAVDQSGERIQGMKANAKQGLRNAGERVGKGLKNAGNFIKQQYNDIKVAGDKASLTGDDQKIADQLIIWFNKGVFGKSSQAKSQISGLINSMKLKYSTKYGEDSSLQKNWEKGLKRQK